MVVVGVVCVCEADGSKGDGAAASSRMLVRLPRASEQELGEKFLHQPLQAGCATGVKKCFSTSMSS